MQISKRDHQHQINEDIRDREIRLIGDDGSPMGIMSIQNALKLSYDRELDLVKIAPMAQPPVCRLMDYGKFRYEQAQKEKEQRRNQHVVEIKEIRLSSTIDAHDFGFKLKNALKFLGEGHKVKVSLRFFGRQMAHQGIGEQQLRKFAEGCEEIATVEKQPKMEGRRMFMFLTPKTIKQKKPASEKRDSENEAPLEKTNDKE